MTKTAAARLKVQSKILQEETDQIRVEGLGLGI